MGVKKGFAGMGGGAEGAEGADGQAPMSKTQMKKEKKGDRVKYRR
jgi:hypothetical protein